MRQEVGAARLLAERIKHADPDCRGQRASGEARTRAEQHEIERHQCKARGCVRAWIAAPARQRIRPVRQQRHVGALATIAAEVARTIHVRNLLQRPDRCRAEDQACGDECGAATQGPQPRYDMPGGQDAERGEADQAHEQGASGVDGIHRPPGIGPDPGSSRLVIKPGVGDPQIKMPRRDHERCSEDRHARDPRMAPPELLPFQ
ncbi:MAG: hypothetical protein WD929_06240 [Steroidobacteraceae bacterium]